LNSYLVALDIDESRLAVARKRCEQAGVANVSFVQGDARELPFADDSFDRVLCAETLEWVNPRERAMSELVRVLKPGGLLLVTHTDFDTVVYHGGDRDLTRKVVHTFCDFADGQLGRKLWGLARNLPLATIEPSVYVVLNTRFEEPRYGYRLAHMMVDWVRPDAGFCRKRQLRGSQASKSQIRAGNTSSASTATCLSA